MHPVSCILHRANLRAVRQELVEKQGSEIRGMFGRIAHRYDLLNRMLYDLESVLLQPLLHLLVDGDVGDNDPFDSKGMGSIQHILK